MMSVGVRGMRDEVFFHEVGAAANATRFRRGVRTKRKLCPSGGCSGSGTHALSLSGP